MYSLPKNEFSRLLQQTGIPLDRLGAELGYSQRTLKRYESGDSSPKPLVIEALKRIVDSRKEGQEKLSNKFRFIDLFAGIGGLRRGFDAIGGKCVFTSEWDPYAQQTYLANYHNADDHVMAGDVTAIANDEIPAHDVLLAGFPCQPFSIAGVSKKNALGRKHGFACEAQGTLFFDVARIIAHSRPRVVLLENVKNLVNHDKGNTFKVICNTLQNELGYKVHFKVIDAKLFVPQHRERIFIVCFREVNSFSFGDLILPDLASGPKLETILHPEDESEKPEGHFTVGRYANVAEKYTLTDHLWGYLQRYAEKHRAAGNGFGFGLCGPADVARTLSARYYKDGSEILVRQHEKNPRRLTPRECARLMGFDKLGQSKFKIPVSDTQAYKQFGNAVVVPVVEAVARHIAPWINGEDEKAEFSPTRYSSV